MDTSPFSLLTGPARAGAAGVFCRPVCHMVEAKRRQVKCEFSISSEQKQEKTKKEFTFFEKCGILGKTAENQRFFQEVPAIQR